MRVRLNLLGRWLCQIWRIEKMTREDSELSIIAHIDHESRLQWSNLEKLKPCLGREMQNNFWTAWTWNGSVGLPIKLNATELKSTRLKMGLPLDWHTRTRLYSGRPRGRSLPVRGHSRGMPKVEAQTLANLLSAGQWFGISFQWSGTKNEPRLAVPSCHGMMVC